jgi:hypothetical protein
LQESLALSNAKNTNINVENGLSGIAFVLLYLIKNKFIDADFEELFREQTIQIQSQMKERDVFSEKDLSFIYFLELLFHDSKITNEVALTSKILNDVGKLLEKQIDRLEHNLFNINDPHYEKKIIHLSVFIGFNFLPVLFYFTEKKKKTIIHR